jgi:threonine dehydrogenase-like Zn-dependent dehydrogenase
MLAIGILRGKAGLHSFELPKPEITQPSVVLVRVKEAGVDCTDFNLARYNLQDITEGRNEIFMGHEMLGLVEVLRWL